MFSALDCELLGDGAGDDIAGGEFCEGVDCGHEAVAGVVEEVGTFASDGFGDEGAWCAWYVEGCWVELYEFHVLE